MPGDVVNAGISEYFQAMQLTHRLYRRCTLEKRQGNSFALQTRRSAASNARKREVISNQMQPHPSIRRITCITPNKRPPV